VVQDDRLYRTGSAPVRSGIAIPSRDEAGRRKSRHRHVGRSGSLTVRTERAFVLDIERIAEKDISVAVEDITAEAARLREDIWDIFASAKTEKLEHLLQGGVP
jgi:hypothetical protein